MEKTDWGKVRHFAPSEFKTDPEKVSPGLVYILDNVRAQAKVPIFLHVAFDPTGHSPQSRHYVDPPRRLLADAADFHFGPGVAFARQLELLMAQPRIGGIGFYPWWTWKGGVCPGWHVDLHFRRPGQVTYWVRDWEGTYHYSVNPNDHVRPFLRLLDGIAANSAARGQ